MVAAVMVGFFAIMAGVTVNRMVTADTLSVDNLNVFRARPGDQSGISESRNTLGREAVVDFQRAGTFLVYARIQNTGGRKVEIQGMPERGYNYFKIDRLRLAADPHSGGGGGDYVPMRPFTLAPGESRFVEIRFRMADCDLRVGEGSFISLSSLPVTYRVLAFTRTAFAEFDREALTVDAGGACDKPFIR